MTTLHDQCAAGQRSGRPVQLSLFQSPKIPDPPAPRRRRVVRDTSLAAFAELDESTVDGRVLAMFRQRGERGLTLDEIAQTGTLLQTACGCRQPPATCRVRQGQQSTPRDANREQGDRLDRDGGPRR